MTIFDLPARNDLPWYNFKVDLSGQLYTLRFRYNTRMQRWIVDIGDASGNDIIVGLPILIERNLYGQYVIESLPLGTSFAFDDSGQENQPTRLSFGTDHSLVYADPTQ